MQGTAVLVAREAGADGRAVARRPFSLEAGALYA